MAKISVVEQAESVQEKTGGAAVQFLTPFSVFVLSGRPDSNFIED
ncbi:MAG TPA: hypothetical protein VFU15_08940 [Bacteroidia bacterium]|nr:hypothetical protein [Bacteroidia bacterium]